MSNTIGWGRGASNNSIGWGNVGTNGFGSIYTRSNSGETILKDPNFIIEVDTSIAGASNTDQFQFTGAVGEYDVEAYQNDNLVASFNDLVNQQTITLPSAGIYELRVIPKPEGFDKLKFNNGGDKEKLLQVLQWGLYGVNEPNQDSAFLGCNLTQIPDGGAWFDVVTNADFMFSGNSLTSLPSGMELPNLTNGFAMFNFNFLTSLPAGMELSNLTIAGNMFSSNSLTSLPSGMELPNLTNGFNMFLNNTLTSLPLGMELPNLTNGLRMFRKNSLTSLPSGMKLPNLTNGLSMFQNNFLTSLPAGMELPNLTNGSFMFRENSLTSLPSGMELPNLTNGTSIFLENTLNTERYSQLLIDLEEFNPNNNVPFHGGNSQYNAQGEIARNLLISRGWTITDGGAENPFQDATVAYSLRDLDLGVTSSVVRVRRSSDNLEQDFTATQITDGSLTTFCGVGDGFVSVWYDQTGVYDLSQATATAQPQIVSAGSLLLVNGKPALLGDGVDDLMNVSFTASNPTTQYVVSDKIGTSGILGGLFKNTSFAPSFLLNSTGVFAYESGPEFSPTYTNNNQSVITFKSSIIGTDWKFFGNGVEIPNSGEDIGSLSPTSINLFSRNAGSQFGNIYIQEYIVMTKDDLANRENVETNINDHYAIY